MMNTWVKSITISLVLLFSLGLTNIGAQTSKEPPNMFTMWIKLALLGKNQAEIEYFFRRLDEPSLEKIKSRVRSTVLENLRRSNVKSLILRSEDQDDLNVVVRKIVTEIRYVGMELDEDLRLSIKEEFGVVLQSL